MIEEKIISAARICAKTDIYNDVEYENACKEIMKLGLTSKDYQDYASQGNESLESMINGNLYAAATHIYNFLVSYETNDLAGRDWVHSFNYLIKKFVEYIDTH